MVNKLTPKDFFYHLAATIALYVGAIALLNLAFSIIDHVLPDVLSGYFSSSSLAWPIAMLVVLVPVLYVIEWLINRDTRIVPEKKDIWISRWRIFLTLFLAGAAVVGDLIVLIFTYLNGEISARFIYKIIVVLLVTGIIFTYYLMKRLDVPSSVMWKNIMKWAGLVIVVICIVWGFVVVGSPSTQRSLRLDQQRISDLSGIQWQVVNYWQKKETLPTSIELLRDDISGYIVPVDPTTGKVYVYKPTGKLSFDLCATFELSSQDAKGRNMPIPYSTYPEVAGVASSSVWDHSAGNVCFSRVIDPEKYKIQK